MDTTKNLFSDSHIPVVSASIADYKDSLKNFQETLAESFSPNCDIRYLVHQRALFTDTLLKSIWKKYIPAKFSASLIAVGGMDAENYIPLQI